MESPGVTLGVLTEACHVACPLGAFLWLQHVCVTTAHCVPRYPSTAKAAEIPTVLMSNCFIAALRNLYCSSLVHTYVPRAVECADDSAVQCGSGPDYSN